MSVRARTFLAFGALALAAGCASVMDNKTVSRIAPDWFEAKSREVKGQGYPSLSDVPATTPPPNDRAKLEADAAQLKAQSVKLETDPQYALPTRTEEEMRANAAQLRALADKGGEPPQPKPSATPTPELRSFSR